MDENENGHNPQGFERIVEDLRALEATLVATVEANRAAFKQSEAELRRIQMMLRTARADQTTPKTKADRRQIRYGEEELAIMLGRIKALNSKAVEEIPGSFTVLTLRRDLGMSKAVAERAIHHLRETERIRLVAERQTTAGRGKPSRIYVINDG